jgi:hypothetical protein
MQYLIEDVTCTNGKGQVILTAATAGDTWMVHNAWKKGFHIWKKQRAEAMDTLPGISGKWSDFKVQLWDGQSSAVETVAGGDTIVPDEWALSEVFWDDDGTEQSPTFCIIGATNATSKIGLVQEYHISRTRPDAFNPDVDDDASDSIYAKMLPMQDELSDALIGDIEDDNDNPPYDLDQMFGGDTNGDEPVLQAYTIANENGKGHTGSFTAECGLIRIAGTSQLTSTFPHQTDHAGAPNVYDDIHYLSEPLNDMIIVEVTVAPGMYKGVAAVEMGQ